MGAGSTEQIHTGVITKSNTPAIAEGRHQLALRRPSHGAEAANRRSLAATVRGGMAYREHRDLLEPGAAVRLGTEIGQGATPSVRIHR
jgi:hypothetical protein